MTRRNTRIRPAWVALAAVLCVWVLVPAAVAIAHDDNGAPAAGEFYSDGLTGGRGPQDVGGGSTVGGNDGGNEADPDTFQIDSRVGGTIVESPNPLPQGSVMDRFALIARKLFMVVFGGGVLRAWVG